MSLECDRGGSSVAVRCTFSTVLHWTICNIQIINDICTVPVNGTVVIVQQDCGSTDISVADVDTICTSLNPPHISGAHDAIDISNDLQSSSIRVSTIFRSGRWLCGSQTYPFHLSNNIRIELYLE